MRILLKHNCTVKHCKKSVCEKTNAILIMKILSNLFLYFAFDTLKYKTRRKKNSVFLFSENFHGVPLRLKDGLQLKL